MTKQQRDRKQHVESGAGWAEMPARLVDMEAARPRAVLVAVEVTRPAAAHADAPWSTEESLDELAYLAATSHIDVVHRLIQRLPAVHANTYLGAGKLRLLQEWLEAEGNAIALFDDELTPRQLRHLDTALGAGRVVDRTQIILDIFAARAHTREGALQVELARARYQLPRLRRLWTHLERQRGGTFTRGGAGETQLETDRRVLQRSVRHLEQELETVRARRADQRRQRHRSWPTLTLVGYTNAGKSTLLNRLTGAQVTARNQLFATLDPTTRRWDLGPDQAVLLTDTVGFIHKLPATLVAAFRATLEEATEADLLLHVVDVSSPHAAGQATVALDELEAIGAGSPILTILNKCDALSGPEGERRMDELARTFPDGVFVSGITGFGLQTLAARVSSTLREHRLTPE